MLVKRSIVIGERKVVFFVSVGDFVYDVIDFWEFFLGLGVFFVFFGI